MTTLWNMLMGPLILTSMFGLLLVVAEFWKRLWHPDPEWSRKLVHLGGGLICISFPFFIHSVWVVLGMTLLFTGVFAWSTRTRFLKSLTEVDRRTSGSEFYPLAIFLVYLLAREPFWLYLSSILVLAVADAFAALIGSHYGQFTYGVEEEKKSLEGSLTFLVIAFLSIQLPMVLLSNLPPAVCVLSALLVALIVTGFEAVALRGSDNLFVPLGVAVILGKITTKPLAEIIYQNLSFIGLCAFLAVLTRQVRAFNIGGALVLILFIYAAWSLGSWHWSLPLLSGFMLFSLALGLFRMSKTFLPYFRVRIVFHSVLMPFLLLLLANSFSMYAFFYGPYLAMVNLLVAMIVWKQIQRHFNWSGWRCWMGAAITSLLAWMMTTLLPWGLQAGDGKSLLAIAIPGLLLGVWNADPVRIPLPHESDWFWNTRRFISVCAVALIQIGLQLGHVLPNWRPF